MNSITVRIGVLIFAIQCLPAAANAAECLPSGQTYDRAEEPAGRSVPVQLENAQQAAETKVDRQNELIQMTLPERAVIGGIQGIGKDWSAIPGYAWSLVLEGNPGQRIFMTDIRKKYGQSFSNVNVLPVGEINAEGHFIFSESIGEDQIDYFRHGYFEAENRDGSRQKIGNSEFQFNVYDSNSPYQIATQQGSGVFFLDPFHITVSYGCVADGCYQDTLNTQDPDTAIHWRSTMTSAMRFDQQTKPGPWLQTVLRMKDELQKAAETVRSPDRKSVV